MTMKAADLFSVGAPWIGQYVADYDSASTALWRLRGETVTANFFIGALRGRRMRRREGVFDQFGALLQFPPYFGENWNGFVDCMRDLDWLRASGLAIVVFDAVEVLADGDADEFGLFLNVLAEAGQSWAKTDEFRAAMPFHVLLHATQDQASSLRAKVAACNRDVPIVEFGVA
jgi:hypothetical protein